MRAFSFQRRPAWVYLLSILAGVVLVSGIPYFLAGKDARRPEIVAVPITLPLPPGITLDQLEAAKVDGVVDGDTLNVIINGRRDVVRYFGVDTPERGNRCYREATDRNDALVGKSVLLVPDARDRDDFGRLLRYVLLLDGQMVDATLVAEGFGLAWRRDGQYRDRIVTLEAEAQAERRGCLWR